MNHYLPVPIPKTNPYTRIFTGASLRSWGGIFVFGDSIIPVKGTWFTEEKTMNINSLETAAILKALQNNPPSLTDCSIHILSDTVTVVSSVKRQGFTKFPSRQKIVLKKKTSNINNFTFVGSSNVGADALSRSVSSFPSEASLSKELYVQLCSKLGLIPEVDLFANRWNAKC